MVKDPQDNSPELDLSETIPVPSGELVVEPVPVAEPTFKTTLTPEQIEAATEDLRGRSFSGRHHELGKMIKCQVCQRRHRVFEFGAKACDQKFTYRIGDYELFREQADPADPEKVSLVPALRTAVNPDLKPTLKQQVGAVQFNKKRFHPHPSKIKLQLIEETRRQFILKGFSLNTEDEQFSKDLQRARVLAARVIRKKREQADRAKRRQRRAANLARRGR